MKSKYNSFIKTAYSIATAGLVFCSGCGTTYLSKQKDALKEALSGAEPKLESFETTEIIDYPAVNPLNGESSFKNGVIPTRDGRGALAYIAVPFEKITDFFTADFWKNVGNGAKSFGYNITQFAHPYHTIKDKEGNPILNEKGKKVKNWAPFYKLWGKNQADSVVGIFYDNRATNGIAGSHWFANYDNGGWKDKSGKTASALLLFLAKDKLTSKDDGSRGQGQLEQIVDDGYNAPKKIDVIVEPIIQPVIIPDDDDSELYIPDSKPIGGGEIAEGPNAD